ncbi:nucleoside triphosphate pyrophosphohydrolase family protein [Haladaptatus cibarius]|uniref:hypothetical protein n=1 Tax=Haladaptatus cibarius TaxID=453847 RepID=UPI000A5B96BE|nr:hypothetical protein [Haladaptatus cibarius]
MSSNFQQEVGEWSKANFGTQPTVNPLLGVTEELGELVEHIETRDRVTEHELDCVGDMLVYLADFCYRRGLHCQTTSKSENLDDGYYDDPLNGVNIAIGYLNRSVLKRRQGIHLDESRVDDEAEQRAIAMLLSYLADFARARGYTLEDCIQVVWYQEVIDREWDSTFIEKT